MTSSAFGACFTASGMFIQDKAAGGGAGGARPFHMTLQVTEVVTRLRLIIEPAGGGGATLAGVNVATFDNPDMSVDLEQNTIFLTGAAFDTPLSISMGFACSVTPVGDLGGVLSSCSGSFGVAGEVFGSAVVEGFELCAESGEDHVLSFDAPETITGAAGGTVEVSAIALLASKDVQVPEEVQGWSLSIAVNGCEPLGATTEGTEAALTEDGGLRDSEASFEKTEVVDPAQNDGQRGVVSSVVLSLCHSHDSSGERDGRYPQAGLGRRGAARRWRDQRLRADLRRRPARPER